MSKKVINLKPVTREELKAIGMTGFEPATPSSRTRCATKLRYIPKLVTRF